MGQPNRPIPEPHDASSLRPDPADPARCPLCGGDNRCAQADGSIVESAGCWCFNASFPAELLARVPNDLRNRACICRRCVEACASNP